MRPAPPRLFVADAPDALARRFELGTCRLRPVVTVAGDRLVRRWCVEDRTNGREYVVSDRAAALALARMINEPLNPRTLPTDWDESAERVWR